MNNIRRVILLLLSYSMGIGCLYAQKNRIFTSQNGLSNSCVNSFYQDSDGYVWISTEDGLNRFDGSSFSIYKAEFPDSTSLKNSNICSVMEDSQNRLWIGTMRGIFIMDPHTNTFKSCSDLVPPYKITSIIEDGNQNIWFSLAGKGMVCLDKDLQYSKTFSKSNSEICSDFINVIFLDRDGMLWIGSEDNGITILDLKSNAMWQKRKGNTSQTLDGNNITSIAEDEDGKILVGTLDGSLNIYEKETDIFKKIVFDSKSVNQNIYSVLCDHNHIAWIGTDGNGLKKYNLQSGEIEDYVYPLDNFLTYNSKIHRLYQDNQGNIWVGVHQKGTYLIVESKSNLNYYSMK